MQIISKRERKTEVTFCREYSLVDTPGAGYSFPCDERGAVKIEAMSETAMANLVKCCSGDGNIVFKGITRYENTYTEPAVGKCDRCKAEVTLEYAMTNTCDKCGAEYNMAGQRLNPRRNWGRGAGQDPIEWSQQ